MKKRTPYGVTFKLFSYSLNHEKIVEWTCLLHARKRTWRVVFVVIVYPFSRPGGTTCEKVILWLIMTRRVILGIGLYLFWPQGLNLRKIPFWSLLSHFRLSKHETTNDFSFVKLIKSNDERPFFWERTHHFSGL